MEEKTLHRREYLAELSPKQLEKFLDRAAPYIGFIIIEFNSLEAMLDFCIKELLSESEGRDDMIYVFLAEMSYSSKVTSLMNLYGQINEGCELGLKQKLVDLEKQLREVARRRNQYAHGQWNDTSEGNFLPVKVSAKRDGVYHVYRKFDVKVMKADLKLIEKTQVLLATLDEEIREQPSSNPPR
jgi:hypothetical protein